MVVRDPGFAIPLPYGSTWPSRFPWKSCPHQAGWRGWLQRALVAWAAALRVAGITEPLRSRCYADSGADDLVVARPEARARPAGDFWIDPAAVTHAHADHARRGHGAYLATAVSAGARRAHAWAPSTCRACLLRGGRRAR